MPFHPRAVCPPVLRYAVLSVFFLLMANAFMWSLSIPYNSAPDEGAHFTTPLFIYTHNRLPVVGRDRDGTYDFLQYSPTQRTVRPTYASMPFIGYAASAACMKLGARFDPRYLTFYSRIPSLLSYAAFLWLVWLLGRRLFAHDPLLSVVFTAVTVLLPQVTFLAAYTNNDMISLCIGTFVIYTWWLAFDHEPARMPRPWVFGAAMGLLLFARSNYYPLYIFSIIAYYIGVSRGNPPREALLKWALAVAGIALAISGWSLVRNYYWYGDPLGLRTFIAIDKPLLPPPLSSQYSIGTYLFVLLPLSRWLEMIFSSSIGRFDWMTLALPGPVYAACAAFLITALLSTAFRARRAMHTLKTNQYFWLYMFMIALAPIALLSSLWFSYTVDPQAQGRYLFPSLLAWTAAFSVGMLALFQGKRARRAVAVILCAGMVVLNGYCLYGVIRPFYARRASCYPAWDRWDHTAYKWSPDAPTPAPVK